MSEDILLSKESKLIGKSSTPASLSNPTSISSYPTCSPISTDSPTNETINVPYSHHSDSGYATASSSLLRTYDFTHEINSGVVDADGVASSAAMQSDNSFTPSCNSTRVVQHKDIPVGVPWPFGIEKLTFEEYIEAFKLPDKGIGRHCGVRYLDIPVKLGHYDASGFLLKILLCYFNTTDIDNMRQVSYDWKILLDKWAPQKECGLLKSDILEAKENMCPSSRGVSSLSKRTLLNTHTNQLRHPLKPVNCGLLPTPSFAQTRPPASSNYRATSSSSTLNTMRQEQFKSAARLVVNKEYLQHCRKCYGPAIVNPTTQRARCLDDSGGCSVAEYCVLGCRNPYHPPGSCPPLAPVVSDAGSGSIRPPHVTPAKWAKRFLKRL